MFRRILLLAPLALAVVLVLNAPGPARAGRGGDALAGAANTYRKQFKSDAKEAQKTFDGVVAGLTKGLGSGATSAEDAATGFSSALAFYARTLHDAAARAFEGFAGEALLEMTSSGDESLKGAVAGDGGSYDAFAEALRSDLGKLRAKAGKRVAKLQKAMARSDEQRGGMRVVLEDWTFSPRQVPDVGGAGAPYPEPLRLWGATATRLTDGRIIVGVFGSAPRELDELFDVRLQRNFDIRPMGDFISDGGMDVDTTGWWSFTGIVNDPFGGDTIVPGNAQLSFGMTPNDVLEPTRFEHGTVLSIP